MNKTHSSEDLFDNFTVTGREKLSLCLRCAELLVLVRKHSGIFNRSVAKQFHFLS